MNGHKSDQSIDDTCSVIFNGTVYSYTPSTFQSLRLEKNATWNELPMGVPVKGGVCVKKSPINDGTAAAMYVVGGVTNLSEYHGLQKFTFATKRWDTIHLVDPVMQNRIHHGAVYLNASDIILVYAGTQDQSENLSSQTFTIRGSEPYQVRAYESIAPPAINPIILPWSENQAVFLGGSASNQKVMLFDPQSSWRDSMVTLADPLPNTDAVDAIIMNGIGSGKALYTFDLSVSPNLVNQTIIVDPDGKPIHNAKPTSREKTPTAMQSLNQHVMFSPWPAYNDSLAPTTARHIYSVSQDPTGLVVFSGGSRTDKFISLFEAPQNSWVNVSEFLGFPEFSQVMPDLSISARPDIAVSSDSRHSHESSSQNETAPPFPTKIIVAILGLLFITAALILGLFTLRRWHQRRSRFGKHEKTRLTGDLQEKKGLDFMNRITRTTSVKSWHSPTEPTSRLTSHTAQMGRKEDPRNKKEGDLPRGSHQVYKNAISKPIPMSRDENEEEASYFEHTRVAPPPGVRQHHVKRSSDWNSYWIEDDDEEDPHVLSRSDHSESSGPILDEYAHQPRKMIESLTIGGRSDKHRVTSASLKVSHSPHQQAHAGEIRGYVYEPTPRSGP